MEAVKAERHNIEIELKNNNMEGKDPVFIKCICSKKFFKVISIKGEIEEEIVCSRCGRIIKIHIYNKK